MVCRQSRLVLGGLHSCNQVAARRFRIYTWCECDWSEQQEFVCKAWLGFEMKRKSSFSLLDTTAHRPAPHVEGQDAELKGLVGSHSRLACHAVTSVPRVELFPA